MDRKKFIVVGTGNRGLGCFAKGILAWETKGMPEFRERGELSGLVDTNLTRAKAVAKELDCPDLPIGSDIAAVQSQAQADWAIITTPDYTHRNTVIAALEAGLNVLVDKPLATSVMECDQILEVMRRTGREVLVGHNARYRDNLLKAARLVRDGAIGEVLTVEGAEVLSLSHGGDYFHRWHSDYSKSAGLLTHKCCHQFDIICWILDDDPVEVSAMGERKYYRPRPDLNHGERCSDCPIAEECPHYFDMDKWDGVYRRIYRECEGDDGYIRDLCVFSDRHTINDHETVNIRFAKGTLCSFVNLTFAPQEYVYFHFTGTKGRIEVQSRGPELRLYRPDGSVEDFEFNKEFGEHGHGGADMKLIADILDLPGSEPIQRACPEEARRAVLVADLANRSIANGGRAVRAEDAGKDYPPEPPSAKN